MGERNDNHFVPRFYLRYWSADTKSTNLFNFSRMRAIEGVSIKGQCQRHNFYAFAPKLEDALGDLEDAAADSIRLLKTNNDVPRRGSDEWAVLLAFIVFQKLRTTNTGRMTDAMTDYISKLWLEGTQYEEEARNLKIENVYPVAIPMTLVGNVLPIAEDLRLHLLINETARQFITSDDPVVLHNQYCEGITWQGVTGWNSTGLQIFFPLSPTELVVLFDADTYKLGRSHRGETVTRLTNERDIAQLNSLQILNAHHNVYYAGFCGAEKVLSECRGLARRRPKTRTTFVETEAKETDDPETSGSILHMYEPLLPVRLEVSKLAVRRDRRRIALHSRANMYRKVIPKTDEERAAYGKPPAGGRYAVKKITHI